MAIYKKKILWKNSNQLGKHGQMDSIYKKLQMDSIYKIVFAKNYDILP